MATVDCLLVAGGGGGGYGGSGIGSGAGGAGGLKETTGITVTNGNYTVVIGAGGNGGTGDNVNGFNGANTSFTGATTAIGGGGGFTYNTGAGNPVGVFMGISSHEYGLLQTI